MRAVVQRVSRARVLVGDEVSGSIGRGLVVLVAVGRDDTAEDVRYLAAKIRDARLFDGDTGRPHDRSVSDIAGSVLLVSQFTLYGDMRKGRRPSFDEAAPSEVARGVYEDLVRELRASVPVETGTFQATMQVELVNDGPITVLLDSKRRF